jgi:hypothetical protein
MKVAEVVEAFRRTEVARHQVVRAIAAHDDWLVPLSDVPAVLRRGKVDRTVWFGVRFVQPNRAQAVFDQGRLLGPSAAGISARR